MNELKPKIVKRLLPDFIEIETSTYCNRHCSWCPNNKYKRGSRKNFISAKLFHKIIHDLKKIQYSGQIALHNYNEPLLDPFLYKHISLIKTTLPKAKILIFTNGDYLNFKECFKLEKKGVSQVIISGKPSNDFKKCNKITKEKLNDLLHKNILTNASDEFGLKFKSKFKKMNLIYYFPYPHMLTSRGGIINEFNPKLKNDFCFMPFSSSAIDFEGNMKICCEVYSANKIHKLKGFIGNLNKNSFLELWFSKKYNSFRKQFLKKTVKNVICVKCLKNDLKINKEKLKSWKKYLPFK